MDESGRRYYYSPSTGESRWELPVDERPAAPPLPDAPAAQAEEAEERAAEAGAEERVAEAEACMAEAAALAPLPPGWEELTDATSGRVCFWNRETGEAQWERPELQPPSAQPVPDSAAVGALLRLELALQAAHADLFGSAAIVDAAAQRGAGSNWAMRAAISQRQLDDVYQVAALRRASDDQHSALVIKTRAPETQDVEPEIEHVRELFSMVDSDDPPDPARLRELLSKGVSLVTPHPVTGETPLDIAMANNRAASAAALLTLGADLECCRSPIATLAESARRNGLDQILALLRGRCGSGLARDELFAAVAAGDLGRCAELLNLSVDINVRDATGLGPLEWAVRHHEAETAEDMVRCLLARSPPPDAEAVHSALLAAVSEGAEGVVRMLLDARAEVARRDEAGWTALDWAVGDGREAIAAELLFRGGSGLADLGRGRAGLRRLAERRGLAEVFRLLGEELLPRDTWESRLDAASGRAVFYNRIAKRTQFEPPTGWTCLLGGARRESVGDARLPSGAADAAAAAAPAASEGGAG